MSRSLFVLSLLGVLLFGGAFGASFVDPLLIERAAREIVRIEIEQRVGEKIDSLTDSRLADFAQRALQNVDADIALTQEALRGELPGKVAAVVADMLNEDCECRARLAAYAQQGQAERLSSLTQVRERLASLIEATYASVTRDLMRELRIFSASNAVAFALLGLITIFRRKATLQLVPAAVVLAGAVAVTGGLYLFNQNWLHTIVFGEYVGLAYAFYLAAVALLLADVVINRARVTTRLVNVALNAVGSAATAVPC